MSSGLRVTVATDEGVVETDVDAAALDAGMPPLEVEKSPFSIWNFHTRCHFRSRDPEMAPFLITRLLYLEASVIHLVLTTVKLLTFI